MLPESYDIERINTGALVAIGFAIVGGHAVCT
jgi:hypothetical protein